MVPEVAADTTEKDRQQWLLASAHHKVPTRLDRMQFNKFKYIAVHRGQIVVAEPLGPGISSAILEKDGRDYKINCFLQLMINQGI